MKQRKILLLTYTVFFAQHLNALFIFSDIKFDEHFNLPFQVYYRDGEVKYELDKKNPKAEIEIKDKRILKITMQFKDKNYEVSLKDFSLEQQKLPNTSIAIITAQQRVLIKVNDNPTQTIPLTVIGEPELKKGAELGEEIHKKCQEELAAYKTRAEKCEQELAQAKDRVRQLEKHERKYADYKARAKKCEKELPESKARIGQLEKDLADSKQMLRGSEIMRADSESAMAEKTKTINKLYDDCRTELNKTKDELKRMQGEVLMYKDKL
jgi:hypothetical protein